MLLCITIRYVFNLMAVDSLSKVSIVLTIFLHLFSFAIHACFWCCTSQCASCNVAFAIYARARIILGNVVLSIAFTILFFVHYLVPCIGDSGGPYLLLSKNYDISEDVIVGVISYCNHRTNETSITITTRAGAYRNWTNDIFEEVQSNSRFECKILANFLSSSYNIVKKNRSLCLLLWIHCWMRQSEQLFINT